MIEWMRARTDDGDVPVVPSLPIVGALPHLVGRGGLVMGLTHVAERYASRGIVVVPLPGGVRMTLVTNAAMAEEVLDDRLWDKAIDPFLESVRRLVGDGLFTADSDDPAWAKAHRVLAPGFSGAAMTRYVPTIVDVIADAVERWDAADGPIDVVAETTGFTLEAIARVGFDRSFDTRDPTRPDPFLTSFAAVFDRLVSDPTRPRLPRPVEAVLAWQLERERGRIYETVDAVIAARATAPRERWPNDLLTRMLEMRDPKSGTTLDHENIRYQVLTFLLAGHETTATLLSFALHYVARDRALAARLREEADRVLGRERPTHAHVRELDLTSRVLDELLRLYPPAPFLMRRPRAETRLGGRLRVTPEQSVAVLLTTLHRDPAVWSDPDRFDPDRFLPDVARARPSHAYRPFGTGKRVCTGRGFALVEGTLALAMIVRDLELADPGPLRLRAAPIAKPHGFRLRVRRRARPR